MIRQKNFEAAYAEAHGMPVEAFEAYRMGDTYRLPGIAKCWRFWNMALDSVVVELPKRWSIDALEGGWVHEPDGANLDHDETVKSIEAAGLKVKP